MLTTPHVNNIATLYLSNLLSWPQLPTLLALSSARLTASYSILARLLTERNIDFVRPTDGIFLFARLGMKVKSAVEEKAFFNRLASQGVRVRGGRLFNGVEWEFGWARVRFSVDGKVMQEAVQRIERFLDREEA
jgi:hypothetical protein